MPANDSKILRERLESLIVGELENQLKAGEITGDRAAEVAKIVLDTVPEDISHDELLKIIPKLDDKAGELSGVVFEILSENDDKTKNEKINSLRQNLRRMING